MKIRLFLVVFLVAALRTYSVEKYKTFIWGSAVITKNSASRISVDIHLLQQGEQKIINGEFPKNYFYFSIAPNERITVSTIAFKSIPVTKEKCVTYQLQTDSGYAAASITEDEFTKLRSTLTTEPSVRIAGYEWYRGYYLAKIEVIPFLQSSVRNSLEQIHDITFTITKSKKNKTEGIFSTTSFAKKDFQFETILRNMILNYDDALPYKLNALQSDSTQWFNPSLTYLKLIIGRDGIYRLLYSQLQNSFPEILAADPKTIKLYSFGKEIPIYVSGEEDGVFNDTDYVEFSAERNYTGKQRILTTGNTEYNEYLNRYTDSTIFWLTFSSGNGLRLPSNPTLVQTQDTLKNYIDFRHLENNSFLQFTSGDVVLQQNPLLTSQDVWGWGWLNGNGENKTTYSVSDLATTGDSGTVYAKYLSWGGTVSTNTHIVSLRVGKGTTSGSDLRKDTIDRYEQFVASAKFPVTAIQNGTSNVSLFSYTTSSFPTNNIIVDWYELEIPRQLKAVSDSLSFRFSNLKNTALRTIQISNLSTKAIAIYKFATDQKRISNVTFSGSGPYTVSFVDTVGPSDRYYLMANAKILAPVIAKKKQFANLRANTSQTDYIIVTHSKFYTETVPLKNYLSTARNFTVKLFDIDDIYDEFAFGYPTSEALQSFLESTTTWQTPYPAYVFLVGDATYDYKFVYKNYAAKNYVPSYGYPVSDPMLVTWKSLSQFPQMITGRLPVNNSGEVTEYLSRLQAYSSLGNSDWNKRYILFSGGDPNTSGQIENFKATNNFLVDNYITPAPIGGNATHFYKTTNPQSDFGPYSTQEFKDVISRGSVFVSYIGHSGTQTWDNSILDPIQLKNDNNKSPLITDFGCSTGKFAEPEITSFSELFVVGSSSYAIGYIGNSALGFTSIAASLPIEFYKRILKDSVTQIGKAHLLSKISLAQSNFSAVNQIMLYTNELIGEPSTALDVPFTPNLAISSSNITAHETLSDDKDSGLVNIIVNNFGSVAQDSVNIYIQHSYNNKIIDNSIIRIPFPLFADTVRYYLQTKDVSGIHTLKVTLDSLNVISEITKGDNFAQASISVLSTKFKILSPTSLNSDKPTKLRLLNPFASLDTTSSVVLELDTTESMVNPIQRLAYMHGVVTEFDISSLSVGKRYWWRAGLSSSTQKVSGNFYVGNNSLSQYGESDSYAFLLNTNSHIKSSDIITLSVDTLSLRAISAGGIAGNVSVIELNGKNILPSSYNRGFSISVIDPITLNVKEQKHYDTYGNNALFDSLASFLTSLPVNDIVISVIADAVNTGSALKTSVKNAYASIGALKQNIYSYKASWAVVGKKGAAPGSALEAYYPASSTKAIVETTFVKNMTDGYFITPYFGPSPSWTNLNTSAVIPSGASLTAKIIGRKNDGTEDTLLTTTDSTQSLASVSSQYPYIKLRYNLTANSSYQSPIISAINIACLPSPEFASSAQQDFLDKQVVQEGEDIHIKFTFFNVGLGGSDSVKLLLQTNDSGNDRTLQAFYLSGIASNDSGNVSYTYNSKGLRGNHAFKFIIDSDNRNIEMYKNNNTIIIPYQVIPDTIRPNIAVTFDGATVFNGDFVRAKPEIRIRFEDNAQSLLTMQDTSNFKLLLNNQPIVFSGIDAPQLIPASSAGKAEVKWSPFLAKGENSIALFAKDVSGNSSDTITVIVNVASDLQLLDVYNFPNPYKKETNFTFKIAGAGNPDDAVIKIFTVAGRLIKEIQLSSPQLKIGYNRISWNGRDEDGDELGNGVYFYKILVNQGGKQVSAIQKLVKAD